MTFWYQHQPIYHFGMATSVHAIVHFVNTAGGRCDTAATVTTGCGARVRGRRGGGGKNSGDGREKVKERAVAVPLSC